MESLTACERVHRAIAREPVDRLPTCESFWGDTRQRWEAQGHLAEGEGVASARRGAQLWLRDGSAGELKLAEAYERLYQESGKRDKEAFRAMRYYRANPETKPFTHPYYWAGFVFSGVCDANLQERS